MDEKRSGFTGKLGFVMAAAGSAAAVSRHGSQSGTAPQHQQQHLCQHSGTGQCRHPHGHPGGQGHEPGWYRNG